MSEGRHLSGWQMCGGSAPDGIKGHDLQYWSPPLKFNPENNEIYPVENALRWDITWSANSMLAGQPKAIAAGNYVITPQFTQTTRKRETIWPGFLPRVLKQPRQWSARCRAGQTRLRTNALPEDCHNRHFGGGLRGGRPV